MTRHAFRSLRAGCFVAALLLAPPESLHAGDPSSAAPPDARDLFERIALARLKEIRAAGEAYDRSTWPGFDPGRLPAVFYQPGGPALASGFRQAPPGFTLAAGAKEGEPALYRAGPGLFQGGPSPALVGGEWAVLSPIEPPPPALDDGHLGRRPAEEAMADFIGDAFLIHLMGARKAAGPRPPLPAAYPDSAELIALTNVEQRLLMVAIQMGFSEKNISEYHDVVRQLVAVRRARWKLLGPDLAALEQGIENWDGLRLYNAALLHRHARSGAFGPTGVGQEDATFGRYNNSVLYRAFLTTYPLMFAPDSPTSTPRQVALRGGSLAFLLDRVGGGWRSRALAGDRSLIDLVSEAVELKGDDEDSFLAKAKSGHLYEPALRLAEADVERARSLRQEFLSEAFPAGPSRLEIRLKGARIPTYTDDPDRTTLLGGGLIEHRGRLEAAGGGLTLRFQPDGRASEGTRLVTRAGARRDELTGILLTLPGGAGEVRSPGRCRPGGEPRKLTPEAPFSVEIPELLLSVSDGTVRCLADGSRELEIP